MNPEIFIEKLKTQFDLNSNLSDIQFEKADIVPYKFLETLPDNGFGEELCLLYSTDFIIFNSRFYIKFLSLVYANHSEILKLDIKIHNELLSNEIVNCRNFLKRKRNLTLTFNTLVKIAELYEIRRIICETVLSRNSCLKIKINPDKDEGINITCYDSTNLSFKYFEANWCIGWDVTHYKLKDFIEFYCNNEIECIDEIRSTIMQLVEPNIMFNEKLKLWKLLIKNINQFSVKKNEENVPAVDAVEISDSDDDDLLVVSLSRDSQNVNNDVFVID